MKKGLRGYILEKYNNMGDAYTCRRLCEEARKRGADLRIVGVLDTVLSKEGLYCGGKRLSPCDFVINRYKSGCVKRRLNELASRSYNEPDSLERYVNKYAQMRDLKSEAYIMPEYLLSTAAADYDYIAGCLGTPFVAKGLESSQGREIFMIENLRQYEQLRNTFGGEKEFLYEQFIHTSYGKDIRLFSVRGNVAACMTRCAREGFRANVALGATVEPLEITDDIRQTARDIYEQTQLDFLGIDLLFGKEKNYFCEINVTPGIEGMERATGVNVAGLIAETIMGDFGVGN